MSIEICGRAVSVGDTFRNTMHEIAADGRGRSRRTPAGAIWRVELIDEDATSSTAMLFCAETGARVLVDADSLAMEFEVVEHAEPAASPSAMLRRALTEDEFNALRALVEQELLDTASPSKAELLAAVQTKLFGDGARS